MSERLPFALPGARPQYGPDKIVDVLHIDLALRPDLEHRRCYGICTTTVRAIEYLSHLVLDACDLDVRSVARVVRSAEQNPRTSSALAYRSTSRTLEVTIEPALRAGEQMELEVQYVVTDPKRGMYFIDHEPRHVWTQSQDTDARSWFPCFDYPAEKQTTSTSIIVPRGMFALGNGELVERVEHDDHTEFRYEQNVPHASYLMTMVAGPFEEVRQPHERVPMFVYTLPGRKDDGERAFGKTPRMIDVFERALGVPYPYARYSQIAVADFVFGGMENTSATTQTDRVLHDERAHLDYSADFLAAHELAHQWFGDLVTCRDWAHAWLNEGFATYFETVWLEADKGWDEYLYDVYHIVQRYLDEDDERYRRPIVCNVFRDPIELFDRHLYEKGGAVLHMLRGELGWTRMKRSLTRYLRENAQRNVETIDLIRAIEAETGRNLRGFFDQWVQRGGHPQLEATYRWDAVRGIAAITVAQKQTIDEANPPFTFDVDVGFLAEAPGEIARDAGDDPLPGETRVRLRVDGAPRTFAIRLEREPALIRIDPAAWVLAEWTFALGTDAHVTMLRADPSPIVRIRAAQALAKDDARSAREALAESLGRDPFWGVSVEVAAALRKQRAPAGRSALLEAVAHPHPKVRRAVAEALGEWRDAEVASALLAMRDDGSYFVAAAALHALGKTRDPRAYDALIAALGVVSWNDTIAAGAVRGLGALADARALEPLLAASSLPAPEARRRAATGALAELGNALGEVRSAVVDAIDRALGDPSYLVRVSAFAAAEKLEDRRLLPRLDRLAESETDGRLRRDAAEAALRVRRAQTAPVALHGLREDVDRLRAEAQSLRARIAEVDPR